MVTRGKGDGGSGKDVERSGWETVDRRTPHRIPPGTAESAARDEGEEPGASTQLLTGFGRGRPNPSASSGQVLRWEGRIGALGPPFDRLRAGSATDSGPAHHERWIRVRGLGLVGGRGGTGALGLLGAAGSRPGTPGTDDGGGALGMRAWTGSLRWDRSGRWDAGMTGGTEGGRRGLGAAWDVFRRSGECVQFWGRCVQFFGRMCPVSRGMCPLWRAMCPVFGGAPWLGMGRGRKVRFLGSAALRSK